MPREKGGTTLRYEFAARKGIKTLPHSVAMRNENASVSDTNDTSEGGRRQGKDKGNTGRGKKGEGSAPAP